MFWLKVLETGDSQRNIDWKLLFNMNLKEILIDTLFNKKSNLKDVNATLWKIDLTVLYLESFK